METAERRVVPRFAMQVPLRFRPIGLIHDREDHAAESINLSRCGVYFASPARLPVGMAVELSLRIPSEITGLETFEARCLGRVVHAQPGAVGDGRTGYGVKMERFMPPAHAETPAVSAAVQTAHLEPVRHEPCAQEANGPVLKVGA